MMILWMIILKLWLRYSSFSDTAITSFNGK